MGRERIYYPTGAQKKGLYTEGRQWMTRDGVEYIGQYHQYINTGEVYTENQYIKGKSVELIPYADLTNESIKRTFFYNKLVENDDYDPIVVLPDPYFPIPTQEDYDSGYITRYFYQKKGSRTIFEVDKEGFGFKNPNYHRAELRWKISGPLFDEAGEKGIIDSNRRTLAFKREEIPLIEQYLTDLSDLSRPS